MLMIASATKMIRGHTVAARVLNPMSAIEYVATQNTPQRTSSKIAATLSRFTLIPAPSKKKKERPGCKGMRPGRWSLLD
jgi:hypothetical protein